MSPFFSVHQIHTHSRTYQPTMTKLLARLALKSLDKLVYDYIKENPGLRLFEIDKETLKSHHQWGTKHVVERLESQGRIFVIRTNYFGDKVKPRYYAER